MYFFFLISGALRLDLKSSGMLGALSLSYIPQLKLRYYESICPQLLMPFGRHPFLL